MKNIQLKTETGKESASARIETIAEEEMVEITELLSFIIMKNLTGSNNGN